MSDTYTTFSNVLKDVPERERPTVDMLMAQAISYVWGFQDAGGRVLNPPMSSEFGWAYGIVVARHAIDSRSGRPAIQDAWKSWQEHGEIRDYNGTALNR